MQRISSNNRMSVAASSGSSSGNGGGASGGNGSSLGSSPLVVRWIEPPFHVDPSPLRTVARLAPALCGAISSLAPKFQNPHILAMAHALSCILRDHHTTVRRAQASPRPEKQLAIAMLEPGCWMHRRAPWTWCWTLLKAHSVLLANFNATPPSSCPPPRDPPGCRRGGLLSHALAGLSCRRVRAGIRARARRTAPSFSTRTRSTSSPGLRPHSSIIIIIPAPPLSPMCEACSHCRSGRPRILTSSHTAPRGGRKGIEEDGVACQEP